MRQFVFASGKRLIREGRTSWRALNSFQRAIPRDRRGLKSPRMRESCAARRQGTRQKTGADDSSGSQRFLKSLLRSANLSLPWKYEDCVVQVKDAFEFVHGLAFVVQEDNVRKYRHRVGHCHDVRLHFA